MEEKLENGFDYIDNQIDIRFESLNNAIDEQQENLLIRLNSFEEKIVKYY